MDSGSLIVDELAELEAAEARYAARARGEEPPAEDYVPTQVELERCAEFASKVKPPISAFVMDRRSGRVRGIVVTTRRMMKTSSAPLPRRSRPKRRPAARRGGSVRRRARAPARPSP